MDQVSKYIPSTYSAYNYMICKYSHVYDLYTYVHVPTQTAGVNQEGGSA